MDTGHEGDSPHDTDEDVEEPQRRQLPDDLPTSLDDRRDTIFRPDVEIYDAWQGLSLVPST